MALWSFAVFPHLKGCDLVTLHSLEIRGISLMKSNLLKTKYGNQDTGKGTEQGELFWNSRLSANLMRNINSRKIQIKYYTSIYPATKMNVFRFDLNFPLLKFWVWNSKRLQFQYNFSYFIPYLYITLITWFICFTWTFHQA